MTMSSAESAARAPSDASVAVHHACPSCGQHIDRTNVRCPRCRAWFAMPPAEEAWSPFAIAAAIAALAFVSYELALKLLF